VWVGLDGRGWGWGGGRLWGTVWRQGPPLRSLFPTGVLSEEQIRKKKIQKQQQQQQPPPVEPAGSSSSASGSAASPGGSEVGGQGSGEGESVQLTAAQELMIQQLVAAQLQCNKRSFSDQPKVTVLHYPQPQGVSAQRGRAIRAGAQAWEDTQLPGIVALGGGSPRAQESWSDLVFVPQPWPLGADPQSRDARQQRFAHFTELAIISVQEIVDFAKQVPGFLQLGREDQIALLKASTIEVWLSPSLLPVRNPRRSSRTRWDQSAEQAQAFGL
jgi:X receptor beta